MAEIYQLPENGNSNNSGIPFSIPIGNIGMGNGYGMNNGFGYGLEGIITLAIVASLFGWNNGGFGGGFGGGNNAAGFLANQLNNDSGRELLMNAINSNGEANRSAVQNLATMLGQDFNLVNGAVMNVQNSLSTLAMQQAVSVPQIINSIQSGNQALAQQFCDCCCKTQQQIMAQGYENQIATLNQTNSLQNTMNANGQRNVDAIADLKATMIQSFCDVKEREMQEKINTQSDIITQLRGQIDNAQQTAAITGYVNSLVSPLVRDVDDIKCKLPNTVPVQFPNLTAVNTTPYVSGGFYGAPFGGGYLGNGFGNNVLF